MGLRYNYKLKYKWNWSTNDSKHKDRLILQNYPLCDRTTLEHPSTSTNNMQTPEKEWRYGEYNNTQ